MGDPNLCWTMSRLDTKYMYVCHAEMNAIMNKNSASVEGCTIYVALFPCNECAKMIIQVGKFWKDGDSALIWHEVISNWKVLPVMNIVMLAICHYIQVMLLCLMSTGWHQGSDLLLWQTRREEQHNSQQEALGYGWVTFSLVMMTILKMVTF